MVITESAIHVMTPAHNVVEVKLTHVLVVQTEDSYIEVNAYSLVHMLISL
jgi:hypothetical protein